jgi:hypothetical protein
MEKNTQDLSADQIRGIILEKFAEFRPSISAYAEYASQVGALSVEYHSKRLAGICPIVELTLVASLPGHETPKSLDVKLGQLSAAGVVIRQAIFDRVNCVYHLFV